MGPAPVTVSRTSLAGTVSCVLNGSGAFEPPSTLASRSLGVIGIAVPPASRVPSVSHATERGDRIHPNGQVPRRVRTTGPILSTRGSTFRQGIQPIASVYELAFPGVWDSESYTGSWSSFREDGSSSRHQEAVSLLRGLDGGTS